MMEDYEKTYEEYWKPLVENEDGSINMDAIKRELSDYNMLLDFIPKVYCEITGGRVSKPNTMPFEVVNAHTEYVDDLINEYVFQDILEELGFNFTCPVCKGHFKRSDNIHMVGDKLFHNSCYDKMLLEEGLGVEV